MNKEKILIIAGIVIIILTMGTCGIMKTKDFILDKFCVSKDTTIYKTDTVYKTITDTFYTKSTPTIKSKLSYVKSPKKTQIEIDSLHVDTIIVKNDSIINIYSDTLKGDGYLIYREDTVLGYILNRKLIPNITQKTITNTITETKIVEKYKPKVELFIYLKYGIDPNNFKNLTTGVMLSPKTRIGGMIEYDVFNKRGQVGLTFRLLPISKY